MRGAALPCWRRRDRSLTSPSPSLPSQSALPTEHQQEAFYLARTGRPGPVLVDVPKDIQQQLAIPDWCALF